jgi:hypothetical protein
MIIIKHQRMLLISSSHTCLFHQEECLEEEKRNSARGKEKSQYTQKRTRKEKV